MGSRTPKWKNVPVVAMTWPCATSSPTATATPARNEYEVRSPSACTRVMARVPATGPANSTRPAADACTGVPAMVA